MVQISNLVKKFSDFYKLTEYEINEMLMLGYNFEVNLDEFIKICTINKEAYKILSVKNIPKIKALNILKERKIL